ncbi:MAG: hypothetical protein ABID38_00485 [Candidatus Diapherotrites archaeon]
MKNQLNIQLPTREEIRMAEELAQTDPENLTDRELWILRDIGGDF